MSATPQFAAALEVLLNRYLALDPEAAAGLSALAGKCIALEMQGLGVTLYLCLSDTGVRLTRGLESAPDATVSGAPFTLLRMLLVADPSALVFAGDVTIAGDNGLVQRFRNLVRGADVDWEEQLAKLMGDPLAHALGNRMRDLGRWGRSSADTLLADLAELFTEEAGIVPQRAEVGEFLDQVDVLRDDVERLQQRVRRLAVQQMDTPP